MDSPHRKRRGSIGFAKSRRLTKRRLRSINRQLPKVDLQIDTNLPGIEKIVLSIRTQKDLQFVVGQDITPETNWKLVPKELVKDSLIFNEESEFLPLRLDILSSSCENILFMHMADDISSDNNFVMCLTEEAEKKLLMQIKRYRNAMAVILKKSLSKSIGSWKSLGSGRQIEDCMDRTSRELFVVEMEALYPIMSAKVCLAFKKPEDKRDGYMELIQTRLIPSHVLKMRIDSSCQISPSVSDSFTQTFYRYSKNVSTQYNFPYQTAAVSSSLKKSIASFMTTQLNNLCDQMLVNANIDLHANDYVQLKNKTKYMKVQRKSETRELMTFSDFDVAKNKMISSVCWHPILSGTVAIAYTHIAPNVYQTGKSDLKEVNSIAHAMCTVLIWCVSDELRPKLRLECLRPIASLSFCPFDESIIVAACTNGQIMVWDLGDKLKRLDDVRIFTSTEKKYQVFTSSFMTWMKNVEDATRINVTAESDLAYATMLPARCIQWLPPNIKINKRGKYETIGQHERNTMQFVTSSLDGSILFWDLLSKSRPSEAHKFMQSRSSSRPAELTVQTSPLRRLNRHLRPHYEIITRKLGENCPLLVSAFVSVPLNIAYDNPFGTKLKLIDQKSHHIITDDCPSSIDPEIYCGTLDGYLFKATWQGYDVDQADDLNKEICAVQSIGKYHDGPVISIERHPYLHDTYLTVGGKVFAIWKDSFQDRPVVWRKSRSRYLHGAWDVKNFPGIRLARDDGNRELWILTRRYNKSYCEESLSGRMILGTYMHPFTHEERDIIGIAESNGTFRLISVCSYIRGVCYLDDNLKWLLDRDVDRKKAFLAWQNSWNKRNQHIIRERRARSTFRKQHALEKERREEMIRSQEERRKENEEEEKRQLAKLRAKPPPNLYFKMAREQWQQKEQEHMTRVLLERKLLNPDLLEIQQMPLKLERLEEERIEKKLKDKLHGSERLFHETVAMLFPDAMKRKPPPPLDPYAGGDTMEEKQCCILEYLTVSEESKCFIEKYPFAFEFDGNFVLSIGKRHGRSLLSRKVRARRPPSNGDVHYRS